jgi:hypothetical protein
LPDPPRAPRFRPPDGAVYLGVSTDYARLPAFATASGRARPALYGRWTTPGGPVQPVLDDAARGGFTPLVHWNLPMDGQRITSGQQDGYLRAQAAAVRAFGGPVFLRLDWEFNTGANPLWSPPAVPPEQYVASWRHVWAIFADLILDWAEAHPGVQALVYFDFVVERKDYRLSAHPVGAAAYRRRVADTSRYLDRVAWESGVARQMVYAPRP